MVFSAVMAAAVTAASISSGSGSQPASAASTAAVIAMTRVFSPRTVQKPARAAVSSAVAAGSGTATAARSASARLFSSTAIARTAATCPGDQSSAACVEACCRAQASSAASRGGVLSRADQLHPAELADGLEHPVADRPAGVDDGEQRLVDQRLDLVEGVVAEQRAGAGQREAVVEDRRASAAPAARPR